MKHIFIVNPAAGQSSAEDMVKEAIAPYSDYDCHVYATHNAGDATAYIRTYCENSNEPVRFYACGGDGTINEVANGIHGFPHASMTCFPCGSGNDFVKYYGGKDNFANMKALLDAEEVPVDLISVNGKISINVTDFGFDAAAAKVMNRVRKWPVLGGKMAYFTGIVVALFTAMRTKCTISADGELLNPKGTILLSTIACGKYVGGAFCCAPRSDNHDGLLEVCVARPVTWFTFIRLARSYAKGKHLDDRRFAGIFTYRRAKHIKVESPKNIAVCLDGEIVEGNQFTIDVLPSAIRFAVPKRCMNCAKMKEELVQNEETPTLS